MDISDIWKKVFLYEHIDYWLIKKLWQNKLRQFYELLRLMILEKAQKED